MNIAIAGKKGTGKDTAADLIINQFSNLQKLTLASPIKNICSQLFNISQFELDDLYIKEKSTKNTFDLFKTIKCIKLINKVYKETYNEDLSIYKKIILFRNIIFTKLTSYRQILQFLGTTICRKLVNKNLFIDNLIVRVENLNKLGVYTLVSDVRFENEVQILLDKGFFTILVKRITTNLKDNHESENSLPPDYEFDFIIYNNGPLDEYFNPIYTIMDIIRDVDGQFTM